MSLLSAAAIASNLFTLYPGFTNPASDIQMITDKGLVLEMVIACRPGEGIITFSKIDRAFCTPDARCFGDIDKAIGHLCR